MALRRVLLLVVGGAVALAALGAKQAWAPLPAFAGAPEIYRLASLTTTGVGFTLTTDPAVTALPTGSRFVISGVLLNGNSDQFGKRPGAPIGRLRVQCTAIGDTPDGYCSGVVNTPSGYFVIAGRGPFSKRKSSRWAVTGGVGPYTTEPAIFYLDEERNGFRATLGWVT